MRRNQQPSSRRLEQRTVSRKTPDDGKLEITKVAAESVESLGSTFPVLLDGQPGNGRLGTMPCTCRGGDKPHVHYFVESDLFRSLTAGSTIDLVIDDAGKRLLVVGA